MRLPLPSPVGAGSRPGSDPWLAFVLVRGACHGGFHAPWVPLPTAEKPYNRSISFMPNPGRGVGRKREGAVHAPPYVVEGCSWSEGLVSGQRSDAILEAPGGWPY
jgi:hypothetical protein